MTPSSSSRRRAVVFDFGGVLISPITGPLADIAAWHDVSMVEILDVLMGPREVSTPDHPWHRAERGELATAELQREVRPWADAAGVQLRGDEYERLLRGDFEVFDDVMGAIRELRAAGAVTGLLTNTFREFHDTLAATIDLTAFDVVVESSAVGCRKPEPEVYAVTQERVRAAGADGPILYFDDFEANLVAARAAGWQTVHVSSRRDVFEAISSLSE